MSKASRDKKKKPQSTPAKEKTQNETFNSKKEGLGLNTNR